VSDPVGTVAVVVSDGRNPDDSPEVVIDLERWRQLASAALTAEGATGELTVTFIDRGDIADLNVQHMQGTGETDVLAFPMDDEVPDGIPKLLGDVVVSPAVAASQYDTHAGTIDDELALLVVHGLLHVLGYDHAEPAERTQMRERELQLLAAHHWQGVVPKGFRQEH